MMAKDLYERRRLYRAQAPIRVVCRAIEEAQVDLDPYDPALALPEVMQIADLQSALDQESRPLWRQVNTAQPEIARYLSVQERKQDLLLHALIDAGLRSLASWPGIDLSEGGVSFHHAQAFEPRQAVHLLLSASYSLHVAVTARILHCRAGAGDYILGTEFVCLRECDRQAIVRLALRRPAQP